MSIRRLVPGDAAPYRALMLEAYETHPEAFTSTAEERGALPLAWWEARLAEDANAKEVVMGTFVEDKIVGVVGLSFETRVKVQHKATLFGMYVPQRFRQRGLGRELVAAALQFAKVRSGVRIVQLTVTEGNTAACSLYKQCGFVEFGVEPFAVAVGTGFVSKVHMWCDLARM